MTKIMILLLSAPHLAFCKTHDRVGLFWKVRSYRTHRSYRTYRSYRSYRS